MSTGVSRQVSRMQSQGVTSAGKGSKVIVDSKHEGTVQWKGLLEGRKGTWLGVEFEDAVGDTDGKFGERQYFRSHPGHGLFVKEDIGRVEVIIKADNQKNKAPLPPEMMEHMAFLFEMFDTDKSGGIDVDELFVAMRNLGQNVVKRDVENIFERIDEDGSGAIDMDEFVDVMRNQWRGMDIGAAVQMIKDEIKKSEEDPNAGALWTKDGAAADGGKPKAEFRPIQLGPISIKAGLFGVGTNGGLFGLYCLLGLGALFHLWWKIKESFLNLLLVASFASMATLFAIGGWIINEQKWATIKMYAVLVWLGAGMQVAICILYFVGAFEVDASAVNAVMDRHCGTCLSGQDAKCKQYQKDVDWGNEPWICCCSINECYDPTSDIKEPGRCQDACNAECAEGDAPTRCNDENLCIGAYSINAVDGVDGDAGDAVVFGDVDHSLTPATIQASACDVVNQAAACDLRKCSFMAKQPEVPAKCVGKQPASDAQCGGITGGEDNCDVQAMCKYKATTPATPSYCRYDVPGTHVSCSELDSEDNCVGSTTCTWKPPVYFTAAAPRPTSEWLKKTATTNKGLTAKTCNGDSSFQDFATENGKKTGAQPHEPMEGGEFKTLLSRTGDKHCFAEDREAINMCANDWASNNQLPYIIFILVFFPLQIMLGYAGWIMPDLYISAHEDHKENTANEREANAQARADARENGDDDAVFETEGDDAAETAENPVVNAETGEEPAPETAVPGGVES